MNINIHDNNFHDQASLCGRKPSGKTDAQKEQQCFYIVAEANNISSGVSLSSLFDTREEAVECLRECYGECIASMKDDDGDGCQESSFSEEEGRYSVYSYDNDYYYGSIQEVRRFGK